MPNLPPHLQDEETEKREALRAKDYTKVGPQGPSKYGPGGRRVAKAKGRGKK